MALQPAEGAGLRPVVNSSGRREDQRIRCGIPRRQGVTGDRAGSPAYGTQHPIGAIANRKTGRSHLG
ncbi:MAG: hypothetical protein CMM61_05770, partial [Rhodospirillaceae bacterium]|nr:hypothetical protein [Rhodospirillaceae bacterium]